MAMSATTMAQFLISKMQGITDPATALNSFSTAIKNYIETYCEIIFTWVALMPPPTSSPDPITSYIGKVTFPLFLISVPPVTDPVAAMAGLSLSITQNVNTGVITPKDSSFIVPPTFFLPTPIVLTPSGATDQISAMEYLCDEIIRGIKIKINPVPLPGVHGAFVIPTPGAIMTTIL